LEIKSRREEDGEGDAKKRGGKPSVSVGLVIYLLKTKDEGQGEKHRGEGKELQGIDYYRGMEASERRKDKGGDRE